MNSFRQKPTLANQLSYLIFASIGIVFVSQSALASKPNLKPAAKSKAQSTAHSSAQPSALTTGFENELTRSTLSMPIENRMSALVEQGPSGYRNLSQMIFDTKLSLEERWRAVTAIGRLGGVDAKPELEKALQAKEWFIRNAGLVALVQADQKSGAEWARKLLSDRALIVRSAAVEVLSKMQDAESASLIWDKLQAKENFRGDNSLWIRRQMVETLAKLEKSGSEPKFIALLKDKDESLHAPAIEALERITGNKLGQASEPLKFRKTYWQNWWAERQTTVQ